MLIAEFDTMPLPTVSHYQVTLRQARQLSGLNHFYLAQLAGVRPRVVYWMELGVPVALEDVGRVLRALSLCNKQAYSLENVRGIRVKARRR